MDMHIAEKEKTLYLSCHVKSPTKMDEGYKKWYARNNEVLHTLTHCPQNMECFIESLL